MKLDLILWKTNHQMRLNDIKHKFCTNEHRKKLFDALCDEVNYMEENSEELIILLFGSFISDKIEPSDIDILISIKLKNVSLKWSNGKLLDPLPIKNKKYVDRKSSHLSALEIKPELKDPEQMLAEFNYNGDNIRNGIRIKEYIKIDLD